jgi:hypothetical protein
MRRKKILLSLGLVLLFLTGFSAVLFLLAKHEPHFYRAAEMQPGEERIVHSNEFVNRFTGLRDGVINLYPDWWGVFTTEQINGFLQEDFVRSWAGDNNLPAGFHGLRVLVEEGRLRLGCRLGTGVFSSVLSIDAKMWLVAGDEPNLIGVEILDLSVGALPVSRQIILDSITEAARQRNIDVRWYRRKSNPVAIFKLQADLARPTIQIQRFELHQGKIVVVGRSTENYANAGAAQ